MTTKGTRTASRRDRRLLESLKVAGTTVRFQAAETIYSQGDRCAAVMFVARGRVRLSVAAPRGQVAVVGVFDAGELFGEGALAGQRLRRSTAVALTSTTIVVVKAADLRQRLQAELPLSDWFRSHLLDRNNRIEQDLVDDATDPFNGGEARLARALLVLAHVDEGRALCYPMPTISRDLLAEMADLTRSRVDALMNEFRKHGFLEHRSARNGGLQVHRSLLNVVLQH